MTAIDAADAEDTATRSPPELGPSRPQGSQRIDSNKATTAGRWSHGYDWPVIAWVVALHAGALAAPFFFTWKGLLLFVVLAWITGGLGVALGYHRLLTHRSFQTYSIVRRTLGMLGLLAGEGPPLHWVAVHRKHHQYTDRPGDPHSPHDGAWWSHVLWLFPRPRQPQWTAMLHRYGNDVLQDPFMRMLDKTYLVWHIILGLVLFGSGWVTSGIFGPVCRY